MDDGALTDGALFARVLQRDQQALAALYDRHGRAAYALALRVVGNPETAEEVVQEAFLTLWRRAETYRPERGALRSWLLTVVRNRAIDVLRGPGRAAPTLTQVVDDLPIAASDDPEGDALREVEGAAVRAALGELSTEQREVVELAFFGGLSYPEVAARIGAPLGTVKSRMRLALQRLRTTLQAQEIGP